jgi:prolipoprotein diacylglyceryltransferase
MRTTLPGELIYVNEAGGARPVYRPILELTADELAKPRTRAEAAQQEFINAEAAGEPEEKLTKLRKTAEHEKERQGLWDEKIMPQLTDAKANFGMDQAGLLALANDDSLRSLWLHPTQLYSAITLMLGSICLSLLLRYRKRHGVVLAAMFLMYGIGRFVLEVMRSDNPHDAGGLTASQAISLGLIASGVVTWLIVSRLPSRSPLAVPYVEKGESSHAVSAEVRATAAT